MDYLANSTTIKKYWIEFFKVDDSFGLRLFTKLKNMLTNLEVDIDDIRGQGYENRSNMKEKHKGVHIRLLEINLRTFYIIHVVVIILI